MASITERTTALNPKIETWDDVEGRRDGCPYYPVRIGMFDEVGDTLSVYGFIRYTNKIFVMPYIQIPFESDLADPLDKPFSTIFNVLAILNYENYRLLGNWDTTARGFKAIGIDANTVAPYNLRRFGWGKRLNEPFNENDYASGIILEPNYISSKLDDKAKRNVLVEDLHEKFGWVITPVAF